MMDTLSGDFGVFRELLHELEQTHHKMEQDLKRVNTFSRSLEEDIQRILDTPKPATGLKMQSQMMNELMKENEHLRQQIYDLTHKKNKPSTQPGQGNEHSSEIQDTEPIILMEEYKQHNVLKKVIRKKNGNKVMYYKDQNGNYFTAIDTDRGEVLQKEDI